MRGTAGNAAAPTARRKNARRGNFMMLPPQCATSRICNPSGRPAGTDYTRLVRRWKGPLPPLGLPLASSALLSCRDEARSAANTLSRPNSRVLVLRQNHRRAAPAAGGATLPFFQQITDIPCRLQRQETIHAHLHSAAARECPFAGAHSLYID